jgi:hypothetical protein
MFFMPGGRFEQVRRVSRRVRHSRGLARLLTTPTA